MIPQRFNLNQNQSAFYYRKKIDPEYYFLLEYFIASWMFSSFFGNKLDPSIEIFRDKGARAYQEEPIPLRLIANPAEAEDGGGGEPVFISLNVPVPFLAWWEPGSVLKINGSGFTTNLEVITELELVAVGRYIHISRAGALADRTRIG